MKKALLAGGLLLILGAVVVLVYQPLLERVLLPVYLQAQLALWYLRSLPDAVITLLSVMLCGLIILSLGYAPADRPAGSVDTPQSHQTRILPDHKARTLRTLLRKAPYSRAHRQKLAQYCIRLLASAHGYPADSDAAALASDGLPLPPELLDWSKKNSRSKPDPKTIEAIVHYIENKAGIHES